MAETTIPDQTQEQFRHLLDKLHEAQTRADERAFATHGRFNVFTTLLEAHDEVRLHTRFLHCLLDPKGCHDCKDLFLKLFFETLVANPGENQDDLPAEFNLPPAHTNWNVENEAPRGKFGRIDILLEQKNFGIAIENKIYAYEQAKQLARYASYLESRHVPGLVLYLTLDGKASNTHAGKIRYIQISYSKHILKWLEKCLRETHDIIPINQVLLQYRAVVLNLTGKDLENHMKPITEFITDNPDIIRYRKQIDDAIDAVCVNFVNRLAERIIKELGGKYCSDFGHGKTGDDPVGVFLVITPPQGSPLHQAPFEIWVAHIAKWDTLVIGIESKYKKTTVSADNQLLFKKMDDLLERDCRKMDQPPSKEAPKPAWGQTSWPIGWFHLIAKLETDELASLLEFERTKPSKTITEICEKIRSRIAMIEKSYSEARQSINIKS